MRVYGETVVKALEADPTTSLPSSSTTCAGSSSTTTRGSCTRESIRHGLRQVHRNAVALFGKAGLNTAFENLEGFPEDWKTNPQAFVKFVRDHQCNSFLEYAEYPYFTSDEIKKALAMKAAFTEMLEQMQ